MKYLMTTALACVAAVLCNSCMSSSLKGDALPYVMIIDVSREIGWISAPVCYYTDTGRDHVQSSIERAGLKPSEAPPFQLPQEILSEIHDLSAKGKPDTKPGNMNFLVTSFFADGRSETFRLGRNDFKPILDRLPNAEAKRPRSMYENVQLYNNP